jgi:hypothetical protein
LELLCAKRNKLLACGAAALLLFACDQAPIFDMISREVTPREPRIKGVPTKMVLFNRSNSVTPEWGMYVADSSLHRYATNSSGKAVWDEGDIPQPPGKIFDLAATDTFLYALVNVDSPDLYRLGQGSSSWDKVGFASDNQGYSRFQAIYGDCDAEGKPVSSNLYVGARNNSSGGYAVFHTTGGDLTLLVSGTGLLTGAAADGTNHYFSTEGDGVYLSSGSPVSGTSGLKITGMINTSTEIIALCGNGDLYTISGGTATGKGNAGINLSGAAAVWTDGTYTLLVAATSSISSTNSTYGYRELVLSSGALPATVTMKVPGTAPSTVDDNKRYLDTIEPKPVNAIFQAPKDVDPDDTTLFASVQGRGTAEDNTDGGLWSYRSRSGVYQWNAEE